MITRDASMEEMLSRTARFKELVPAIAAVEGFNVTHIGANPGTGCSLHSHDTV